jgi:hypothetical protein
LPCRTDLTAGQTLSSDRKCKEKLDEVRIVYDVSVKFPNQGRRRPYRTMHVKREEASMTRAYFSEIVTETIVFTTSAGFLAWYIAAKIAVWPWGAYRF